MNEIINKCLLVGDKFIPEMHLRRPGFTYSVCGPFTKNKERIEKFVKTVNTDFIYKNELDKACSQHDMAYGKSKDSVKRTQLDKVLRDKAFKISSDPVYDGYQRGLGSLVYNFFDKKSKGSGIINESNHQLANELQKPVIIKLKKIKVYSSFRDNIWGADLADMQSFSKYNKGIKYLLCVIDLFNIYAWVILLKDKKGTILVNAFQKIISNERKPNKIWVDQGSEFYNQSFKDFLKTNNIEMYVADNFKKQDLWQLFQKNIYFDVLDDIVNKYNNTVHRTNKMKPIDVTNDSYAEYNEDSNKKNS